MEDERQWEKEVEVSWKPCAGISQDDPNLWYHSENEKIIKNSGDSLIFFPHILVYVSYYFKQKLDKEKR